MIKTPIRARFFLPASLCLCLVTTLMVIHPPAHAASITVNEPANGQTFTGNDFTTSGVADANASIILIRNGLTIAQTRSDSSGYWSVKLNGLPDGNNTITARSIKNSGYGYYVSSPDAGNTVKINQLRLSDNAINPLSPYPVTDTNKHVNLAPSPSQNIFYATSDFYGNATPAKFNLDSPASPTLASGSYPSNAGPGFGAFNADGTKYYSPNITSHNISVIDVASNAWIKNIAVPTNTISAWMGPNGKIYVGGESAKLYIIDSSADTVVTRTLACATGTDSVTSMTFSQDSAYPYYFAHCLNGSGQSRILKIAISDSQLAASFNVSFLPTNGILNADNSRLYVASSSVIPNNPDGNKLFVIDTTTGSSIKTLTMHAGILGFFQSPDLQHIYAATPGDFLNNNPSTGIDEVDMFTDSVTHITTTETNITVSAPSTAATLSNVNVSVVLGVKTTTGSLADTGAIAFSSTLLLGIVLGSATYIYYDYRKHKKPLVQADPNVHYTLSHHIKVVTLPLLRYRLSLKFETKPSASNISKF